MLNSITWMYDSATSFFSPASTRTASLLKYRVRTTCVKRVSSGFSRS
jgi:hypothetical protein